jgi:peptide/nickel transport system substrate-binding protein
VRVLGIADDPYPPAAAARDAARALTALGYRVQLRIMTRAEYGHLPGKTQGSFEVFPFGWYADFPSPATFFQSLLPCFMHGRVCEQALDPQINRALLEEAEGRGDHVALWSAIDRRATQLALTVPVDNPRAVELTSSRLHGYEFSPQWGFLPALASLR